MRTFALGWMVVFAPTLSSAPVPRPAIDPNLVGRWKMVGYSPDLSKTPIRPSFLPVGIDLVYVFRDDGRLELRNEFSYASPDVRTGTYEVFHSEVRHTATWDRDRGKVLTMRIERLSPGRVVLTEDGTTLEFERIEIAPAPRAVVGK
ncbi:hypothetical protein GobsT_57420 [Gemmata obscuriglobus]|uniref:Lipocalin-like domain-containing protein n=1 Tax=Gemmata obscuriglobus TaxID=114 RepID=A0A2Z3GRQ1_9BACT|nr:hypothetical protein [Gemmata obscuriglobus]AWM36453.1 hypothetical protein C1280_05075 [Gemmata obscuriglobus]QEG30924.1 hypothetical protein GobsT_57420 [Gemmata obscuriglobus]VTS10257.1 unnamed protein product [Gemmata obscuriglobus UQM 2246]